MVCLLFQFHLHHPVPPRVILINPNLRLRPKRINHLFHPFSLLIPDLQQHNALRFQHIRFRNIRQKAVDEVETFGAAEEGEVGFVVVDVGGEQGDFVGANIGQIGGQHVDGFGQGLDEVALQEMDALLYVVAPAIEGGDGQGAGGDVGGVEVGQMRFADGKGDGDGAAAGADVGHDGEMARYDFLAAGLQRDFDEQFGFGAWDEHAPVNDEVEPVKFFVAGEVGDRFLSCASFEQRQVVLLLFGGEFAFGVGVERAALDMQDVAE